MKVVLLQTVKGVGRALDTVDVSDGYAKNYLIPRKLAKVASNQVIAEASGQKSAIAFKKQTQKEEAIEIKNKIEETSLVFKLKAKNGKFFGSITSKEISEELSKKIGTNIDKKKVELEDQIKTAGVYKAQIKLYEGVIATAKVRVEEE